MMRTCSSTALAKTIGSVSALRRRALWSARAVFGTLHGFALAIYVSSGVRAFRFLLLLLLVLILCGLLSGLCERWKQYGCERKDGNKSAKELMSCSLERNKQLAELTGRR